MYARVGRWSLHYYRSRRTSSTRPSRMSNRPVHTREGWLPAVFADKKAAYPVRLRLSSETLSDKHALKEGLDRVFRSGPRTAYFLAARPSRFSDPLARIYAKEQRMRTPVVYPIIVVPQPPEPFWSNRPDLTSSPAAGLRPTAIQKIAISQYRPKQN